MRNKQWNLDRPPNFNQKPYSSTKSLYQNIVFAFLNTSLPITTTIIPWDDFLDFSRVSLPKHGFRPSIVECRLKGNLLLKFRGNYTRLWMYAMIVAGVFFNKRILVACVLSFVFWVWLCWMATQDETSETFYHRKKSVSNQGRNVIGAIVISIIFYLCSTLKKCLTISIVVFILSIIHALARPVLHEADKKQVHTKIASDGFVEEFEKEDTVDFVNSSRKKRVGPAPPPGALPGIVVPMGGVSQSKRD